MLQSRTSSGANEALFLVPGPAAFLQCRSLLLLLYFGQINDEYRSRNVIVSENFAHDD